MLCYKDRTFCPFYLSCKSGRNCTNALTEKVVAEAIRSGLPTAEYTSKPGCFLEKAKAHK